MTRGAEHTSGRLQVSLALYSTSGLVVVVVVSIQEKAFALTAPWSDPSSEAGDSILILVVSGRSSNSKQR